MQASKAKVFKHISAPLCCYSDYAMETYEFPSDLAKSSRHRDPDRQEGVISNQ